MSQSQHPYVSGIERAIALIEQHLSEDDMPSLSVLAEAAFMSKFHFHRIYRLLTGETCQQTMTRLKLAKATHSLTAEGASVTSVAHESGYSSSQALAKALKRVTNTSATALRKEPERLADTIAFLSKPDLADADEAFLSVELVDVDALSVAAIRSNRPYEELNDVYEQLFTLCGGPENVRAILGINIGDASMLHGYEGAFCCALQLQDDIIQPQSPLIIENVHNGIYARVRHQGSFDKLDQSIDAIYGQLLATPELTFSDLPCVFHYLDDPESVEEAFLRTDIYVPVVLSETAQ